MCRVGHAGQDMAPVDPLSPIAPTTTTRVRGQFTVEHLKVANDGTVLIAAISFEQYCDDQPVPATGRITYHAGAVRLPRT